MYYCRLVEDEEVNAFIVLEHGRYGEPSISLNGNCNTKLEKFIDISSEFICVIQKGESYPLEKLLMPLMQLGFAHLNEIKVLRLSASDNIPELTADWSMHVELISVEVCTFDTIAWSCFVHTDPGTEGTPTVSKVTIDPEDPIYAQIDVLESAINELKTNMENSNETLEQTMENFITNPVTVDLKIPENELKPLTDVMAKSITNVSVTAELVANLRELYQNIAKSTVDTGASAAQVATEMEIWRRSVSDFLQQTAESNITLTEAVKKYEQVQRMQSESFTTFNTLVGDTLSDVRSTLTSILQQRQAELRAESNINSDKKMALKNFLNSPIFIALGSGLGLLFAIKLIKEVVRG